LTLKTLMSDLKYSSLTFVKLSWEKIAGNVAINWKNFAQVIIQLKLVFKISP